MNLAHLKPGDEVCVRTGRWQPEPRYELARVTRVSKTTVTIADGRRFTIKAGRICYGRDQLSADIVQLTQEIQSKIGGR